MKSARWRKGKSQLFCNTTQKHGSYSLPPHLQQLKKKEVEARTESEEVERKDENKVKQK